MESELMNSSVAGQLLSEVLGDRSPDGWALWLRNNRNQTRQVPYRVPFEKISNGAFYSHEDLAEFIKWEKSRQLGSFKVSARAMQALDAFGVGHADGSSTGRKLKLTGITSQVDEATGQAFIQMILDDPLRVYRLPVEQAEAISKQLTEAVHDCKRNQK